MVLPLSDDNSDRRTTPIVNYVLIAANVFVFVVFQGMGANDKLTYKLATVPAEIRTGKDVVTEDRVVTDPVSGQKFAVPGLQPTPTPVYLTLLTSMFMHGGIAHLLGNMWFLWIFGDNVEDRMGHFRYLVFYLLTGLIASLCHVAMNLNGPSSLIPSLGASGAISGVMGAYLALCPSRRVRVLMLRVITEIPGYMAVGLWFLFQLISGLGLLGGGSEGDGVAYAAHIGGFAAGALLARPFLIGREAAATISDWHATRCAFGSVPKKLLTAATCAQASKEVARTKNASPQLSSRQGISNVLPDGLEQGAVSSGNNRDSEKGAAYSGAVSGRFGPARRRSSSRGHCVAEAVDRRSAAYSGPGECRGGLTMTTPSTNGSNGRDAGGRFASGNRGGPGNPYAKRTAAIRGADARHGDG